MALGHQQAQCWLNIRHDSSLGIWNLFPLIRRNFSNGQIRPMMSHDFRSWKSLKFAPSQMSVLRWETPDTRTRNNRVSNLISCVIRCWCGLIHVIATLTCVVPLQCAKTNYYLIIWWLVALFTPRQRTKDKLSHEESEKRSNCILPTTLIRKCSLWSVAIFVGGASEVIHNWVG